MHKTRFIKRYFFVLFLVFSWFSVLLVVLSFPCSLFRKFWTLNSLKARRPFQKFKLVTTINTRHPMLRNLLGQVKQSFIFYYQNKRRNIFSCNAILELWENFLSRWINRIWVHKALWRLNQLKCILIYMLQNLCIVVEKFKCVCIVSDKLKEKREIKA